MLASAQQQQQRLARGGLARARACPRPQAPLFLAAAAGRRRAVVALAPPPRAAASGAAADALDDDDEADIDWTEDMPAPVRRRVRALRDVQARMDDLARKLARERAALEAKFEREAAPLAAERAEVVSGAKAVERYDVLDDEDGGTSVSCCVCVCVYGKGDVLLLGEKGSKRRRSSPPPLTTRAPSPDPSKKTKKTAPDSGIPDFWLTAMTNHDMVGEYVTERDAEVLACLTDVRAETLTGDDSGGFRLAFEFSWPPGTPPAFANKPAILTKTFYMEDSAELVPKRFVGTDVQWAAGRDPTVQEVRRKKKKKGGKGGGKGGAGGDADENSAPPALEPCDSFFRFFRTPEVPEDPAALDPDDLDALQEQMDEDYEIGCAVRDQLVPRAVEWFTGEASAAPFFGDEDEEEGEGGEE
jgi:nucleosome assembly protein 1-like 1